MLFYIKINDSYTVLFGKDFTLPITLYNDMGYKKPKNKNHLRGGIDAPPLKKGAGGIFELHRSCDLDYGTDFAGDLIVNV